MLPASRDGSVVDGCCCWFVAECGRGDSVVGAGGDVLDYVCGIVCFVTEGRASEALAEMSCARKSVCGV